MRKDDEPIIEDKLLRELLQGAIDPSAEDQNFPPPDWIDDEFPYQPSQFAGRGGSGFVWKARHRKTNEFVALKVIVFQGDIESARERWLREARIAASGQHLHLMGIIDSGLAPDGISAWLALEWINGGDLQQRLEEKGPIPWKTLSPWILQICDGLGALHQIGLIHRDLKPSNLLLESDTNRLVVSDFGAALEISEERVTRTSDAVVSFGYAAPEQLKVGQKIDSRADQFSLAVTIWELLTGELPVGAFPKLNRQTKDIPFWLDKVLRKALSRDPEDRYSSLTTFCQALRPGPHVRRRTLKIIIATLILSASVFGIIQYQKPPPPVVIEKKDQNFQSQSVRVLEGMEVYIRFNVTLTTTGKIFGTISTYSKEKIRKLTTQGAMALMNADGEAELILVCPRFTVDGEYISFGFGAQASRSDYFQSRVSPEMAARITDIHFMAHRAYDQENSPWYRDFPDTEKQQVHSILRAIEHDDRNNRRKKAGLPPLETIKPIDHLENEERGKNP